MGKSVIVLYHGTVGYLGSLQVTSVARKRISLAMAFFTLADEVVQDRSPDRFEKLRRGLDVLREEEGRIGPDFQTRSSGQNRSEE